MQRRNPAPAPALALAPRPKPALAPLPKSTLARPRPPRAHHIVPWLALRQQAAGGVTQAAFFGALGAP